MNSEFWFISIPGEKKPDKTFQDLNQTLNKYSISSQWKFQVPSDLKVGTLDVLVGLSDELSKLDIYAEGITRKLAHYMGEVLEEQRSKLPDNLTINGSAPINYVTKFQWDSAKYPIKQTLRSLYDLIAEQISKMDGDLKIKSQAYNTLKGNLQNLEKKQTGSLMTRALGDIVKKEQFVVGSEYLTTLVVVVPKSSYNDWLNSYENLIDKVVPRSSEMIFEDQENGLFTVTLFTKLIDDFKNKAREKKFYVREFVYDEKKIEEGKTELTKLESEKRRQFAPLFRWLKVNFGEAFAALMHVKALRVFVESVLRYGLPVDFVAVIIQPNKRFSSKLRNILNQSFNNLDGFGNSSNDDDVGGASLAATGVADYYPYVSFKLETNMCD